MVPYTSGTPQIINDMMGKRVGLVFEAYSGLAGAIDAGNVVPLAVASASKMTSAPNLPTVAETLPGFESVGWQALVAPAGTPDALIRKVNADIVKAVRDDPEIHKRLIDLGRDDRMMSPAELLMFIRSEQTSGRRSCKGLPRRRKTSNSLYVFSSSALSASSACGVSISVSAAAPDTGTSTTASP
jgi:tripartite-type tricarboxylate transporter receptor subunit TctC